MKRLSLAVAAVATLALTACGGGGGAKIESKEDAARALNRLAYATSEAKPKSSGDAFGGELSVTVSVKGKQGSARVTQTMSIEGTSAVIKLETEYEDFSADDENVFNGKMTTTMRIVGEGMSGKVEMDMNGRVQMEGEYDADMEVDIKMAMNASELANQSGARVSMTLTGYIKADGKQFDYVDETITVEAHGG